MKTAVIFGAAPIKNYETVKKYPHNGALQYYGKTLSYKKFYDKNKALKMLKELRKKTRTMPGIVRGPTHVVIELLGHLISALDNPALSKKQKALVMGAIGYIVTPIDLISDLIPVIGFVDDIASTVIIVQTIRKYSTFKMQQLDELIDSELSSNDETDKNDKLENNKKDGE